MAVDPTKARQFAKRVVATLRAAGFEALWAGGCVRDQLLGDEPKDYDVATSATPDQIRELFGTRRTLAIGAAFGVITVLGPRAAGPIEVATFRRDASYSDGRHPDSVAFSNAQEDAQRRDFTINGLFYDPLDEEVIDYVGGQPDLKAKMIRAIGNPDQRLAEDKLRMLRAVRFAAALDFTIDAGTMQAIQRHAHELSVVSVERITAELRRVLLDGNRRRGVELLKESRLLEQVLPELDREGDAWRQTVELLEALDEPTSAVAFAAWLRAVHLGAAENGVVAICRRWKLTNDELDGVLLCLTNETTIRQARARAWPELQRVLILPRIDELLSYCQAVAQVVDGSDDAIRFCREILARPRSQWNPPPLITGEDLKQLGIPAGPVYRELLTAARDAQLNGEITERSAGLEFVKELWKTRLAE